MNNTPSKKILICHEEESIRESLKLILGDHYDMVLTDSDEQCLECLDHDKTIGLVLLGLKASPPARDKSLQAIKEKNAFLPIIAVTNNKSAQTPGGTSLSEISGYITRPFRSDEIFDMIRKNIG